MKFFKFKKMKWVVLSLLMASSAMTEASEVINCEASKYVSFSNLVEEDVPMTATLIGAFKDDILTVSFKIIFDGKVILNAENLSYTNSENKNDFSLVQNEIAQNFKYENSYFVPIFFGITRRMAYLSLPTLNREGAPRPSLIELKPLECTSSFKEAPSPH